jgi:hypothetical protein
MDSYVETISTVPADEHQAENYAELLELWRSEKSLIDAGQPEFFDELTAWEEQVNNLLRPEERERFSDDQVVLDMDVLALRSARIERLARILVARHGVAIEGPVL